MERCCQDVLLCSPRVPTSLQIYDFMELQILGHSGVLIVRFPVARHVLAGQCQSQNQNLSEGTATVWSKLISRLLLTGSTRNCAVIRLFAWFGACH